MSVVSELSALVRQVTSFCEVAYRAVSFWTGTVTNSPPVGAGAVPPSCAPGSG